MLGLTTFFVGISVRSILKLGGNSRPITEFWPIAFVSENKFFGKLLIIFVLKVGMEKND